LSVAAEVGEEVSREAVTVLVGFGAVWVAAGSTVVGVGLGWAVGVA
jgi:hypothetical protein